MGRTAQSVWPLHVHSVLQLQRSSSTTAAAAAPNDSMVPPAIEVPTASFNAATAAAVAAASAAIRKVVTTEPSAMPSMLMSEGLSPARPATSVDNGGSLQPTEIVVGGSTQGNGS